ncbi:MAG: hypothetical protein V2B19_22580 [Pseudomonadota bacterium]
MEALRVWLKPEKGILTIKLPESLARCKELEVIIFPVDQEYQVAAKEFNPSDYFGAWKTKNIDMDPVCKKMREEWDRGF